MYYLNKIVGCVVSPVGAVLAMIAVSFVLFAGNRFVRGGACRAWAKGLVIAAGAWLWMWSTPLMSFWVGATLEREFLVEGRPPKAENFPDADAILLLGGSMASDPKFPGHSEMWSSADRVRMAARLWKAGKAPKIFATGLGVEKSTKSILQDFGVPPEAVVFADSPRDTEEEAKLIVDAMSKAKVGGEGEEGRNPAVLVVTSAWHMKRAMLIFRKYAPGLGVIPAATDFENTMRASRGVEVASFFPSPASLMRNSVTFHEWLGYFVYAWLR